MANGTKIQTSRATSNRIMGRGSYGLSTEAGGVNPNALPMPQGISLNTATGFGQAQMIVGNTMMNLGNTIGKIGIAIDQQNEVNEKAALVAQGNTLEQLTKQLSTIKDKTARATFIKDVYDPAFDNYGKGVRDSLIPIVNATKQSIASQRQVIETGFLQSETVAATHLNLNKNKDSLISAKSIPEWYKYYLDYESNLMTTEGSSVIPEKMKSKEREEFHKIKNSTLLSLAKEKFNGLYQTLSSEKFGTLLEKFVDKGNLYDPSDTNLSQTQKAELALLEKVLDKNIGPSEIRDLFYNAQQQKLDSLKQKNDFHDEREEALNRNGDMAEQKNTYEKDVFQRLIAAGSIEKQSSLLTQLNAEVRLEKDSYLREAKKKILKDVFERMKTISSDQRNNLELLMNAIGDKVDDAEVGGTGNTWKDLFLFGIDGKKLTTDQMNAAIGRLRKQFPEIDTAKNTNLVIESTFRKVYGAESKIYQDQKNQLKIERGKIEEQAKRKLTPSEGNKYKARKNAQLDAAVGSHLGKSTFNEALKEYGKDKDLDGDKPPPRSVIPERKLKAIVRLPDGTIKSVDAENANPDDVLTSLTGVQNHLNIRVEGDSKNDVAAQHVMRITDGDPSVLFTEGTREDRNKMVSKYLKDNKISPRSRKAREIYDYINTIENNFIDKLRSAYSDETNPYKMLQYQPLERLKTQRKQIAEGLRKQMEEVPKNIERQKEEIPEGLRKQVEELKGGLKEKLQPMFDFFGNLLSPNPAGAFSLDEPSKEQETGATAPEGELDLTGSRYDLGGGKTVLDELGNQAVTFDDTSRFRSDTGGITISDFDKDDKSYSSDMSDQMGLFDQEPVSPDMKNQMDSLQAQHITGATTSASSPPVSPETLTLEEVRKSQGKLLTSKSGFKKLDVGDGKGGQNIVHHSKVKMASKKDAKKAFENLFSGNTETDRLSKKAGKMLIDYEGVATEPYFDTKGVITFGLGFTGEEMFLGNKSIVTKFKEILPKYIERAKAIANQGILEGTGLTATAKTGGIYLGEWHKMTDNMKSALIVATFRGDIIPSHRTGELISNGKYEEAAKEFLDNWDIAKRFLGYTGTRQDWNSIVSDDRKGLVETIRVAIENDGKEYGKGTLKHRFQYIYNSIKKEADRKSKKGKN